jgi:hypothetical protein
MASAGLDNNASNLTEQHRAAICRELKGIKVPEEFWRELEDALDIFRVQEQNRAKHPPKQERAEWQQLGKLLTKSIAVLQEKDVPWRDSAVRVLEDIKFRSGRAAIAYDTLATGYDGQSKPHRELFYATLLELWVRRLGQEPSYWRLPSGGEPRGALINFYRICVAPVFGNAVPPAHTIAGIIDRQRKRYDENQPLKFKKAQRKKKRKY